MRFVFSPPAGEVAGLLTLPWAQPLEDWHDERLVEIRQRGISRHIVRFVERQRRAVRAQVDQREPGPARVPAAALAGRPQHSGCRGRRHRGRPRPRRGRDPGHEVPGVLQHLPGPVLQPARRRCPPTACSTPWSNCSSGCTCPASSGATARCPMRSSAPMRAPTRRTWSTPRPARSTATLTDGQRGFDLELAAERVCGELMDLQAGELLPDDVDPIEVSEDLVRRYRACGRSSTTRSSSSQRISGIGSPSDCGGSTSSDSMPTRSSSSTAREGTRLRVRTRVAESGESSRAAVPADRHRRRGASGPQAAERHRQLPRLPRAEERPRGLGDGRRASLARGGLRPRRRGHPGRPARPACAAGDLPRDPGAPLVHVRGGRPGRRHDRRGALVFRHGAARRPAAAAARRRLSCLT